MPKMLAAFAAIFLLWVIALPGPADAAARRANGIASADQLDLSAQRRYYRRGYRGGYYRRPYYGRPYYRSRAYRPYYRYRYRPYYRYGYYRPYYRYGYYRPYYYGRYYYRPYYYRPVWPFFPFFGPRWWW
jgi:hypothetical protein